MHLKLKALSFFQTEFSSYGLYFISNKFAIFHLGLKSCSPYPVNHYPYRLGPLLLLHSSAPPLVQIFNISPMCSYDSPLTGFPLLRIGASLNTAITLPKNGCPSRIIWLPCSNTQIGAFRNAYCLKDQVYSSDWHSKPFMTWTWYLLIFSHHHPLSVYAQWFWASCICPYKCCFLMPVHSQTVLSLVP